ncbi:Pre-rRNA processing protein [Aspergillus sclerotialis]|uniref:Pre-rRNA processing protein n=1 Tax=Aspergillus sclerotialis TaxID=2070753 RepID=A0A3A2Z6C2_9EURO|nr:Pre-rRNA processing protein [Aspergillus sclerotialis]
MSTQQQQPPAPQPTSQPTPSTTTNTLDLGITLALHGWPALTMAVQSSWGGPTSSDKRDWLCGAISDMIAERPETDAEDLEDVLVQVMNDEFDVVVDDDSAADAAAEIMRIREAVARGDTSVVDGMRVKVGMGGDDDDDDDDDDGSENGNDGEDVEMGEAPQLVSRRERVEPEVDEDGFTKVVGKKKR